MKNNFEDVMSKKTNEELARIISSPLGDYQIEAVKAAEQEINKRNIIVDEKSKYSDEQILDILKSSTNYQDFEVQAAEVEAEKRNIAFCNIPEKSGTTVIEDKKDKSWLDVIYGIVLFTLLGIFVIYWFNLSNNDIKIFDKFIIGFNIFLSGITDFINNIGKEKMALCILILSVILFLMRIVRKKDVPRQGAAYIISNTLFLTVCALDIFYIISVDDSIWFCVPDHVGWIWTVINFFLLGGIVYNQILYLFDVIDDVFSNGNAGCDLRLGLYGWGGGFVCALLCSFFYKEGLPWIFLVVGIMQIIQSVLIFRSYGKNIKGAFWGVFVYLLGTIGTVVIFMVFLGILIIIVIGFAVLWFALKLLGGSDSKTGKVSVDWSDGRSEEAEETGRGILGERYYRGKETGREFQD